MWEGRARWEKELSSQEYIPCRTGLMENDGLSRARPVQKNLRLLWKRPLAIREGLPEIWDEVVPLLVWIGGLCLVAYFVSWR